MTTYKSLADADLFSLLYDDDQKAYAEIYSRYSGVLYAHDYKRIRNREEAGDLDHELFTVLWSNRNDIVLKTELSSYLYGAVKSRIIDLANHNKLQYSYYYEKALSDTIPCPKLSIS